MERAEIIGKLVVENEAKMVILVIDGLGGLPHPETGLTELEAANIPNMDGLAKMSICGLSEACGAGITPGSGPAHLAIFGYDPFKYEIGRGALSALGVDFPLGPSDVAARVNFATVEGGLIKDRRAGRISTEKSTELCRLLSQIKVDRTEVIVWPEKEHRAVAVFRGQGLSDRISDTDPQKLGVPPLPALALSPEAEDTARVVNDFISRSTEILSSHIPANHVLLRGFAKHPQIPSMGELYKLKCAAIAAYPMYRGLAKLLGMQILKVPSTLDEQFALLEEAWPNFNFFFVHYKATDSAGEDGDFERKVKAIEEIDPYVERVLSLNPECFVVTGDHSTPAVLGIHSWHPNPFMLYSRWGRYDDSRAFSEKECARGKLGVFPAVNIMPLAMAHTLKLTKFGA